MFYRRQKNTNYLCSYSLYGTPKGNRTPDSTVRGWRLDRLTIGAFFSPYVGFVIIAPLPKKIKKNFDAAAKNFWGIDIYGRICYFICK